MKRECEKCSSKFNCKLYIQNLNNPHYAECTNFEIFEGNERTSTNYVDYQFVNENDSAALISDTNIDTLPNYGSLIYSTLVNSNTTLNIDDLVSIKIQSSDSLVVTGLSSATNTVDLSINWNEEI